MIISRFIVIFTLLTGLFTPTEGRNYLSPTEFKEILSPYELLEELIGTEKRCFGSDSYIKVLSTDLGNVGIEARFSSEFLLLSLDKKDKVGTAYMQHNKPYGHGRKLCIQDVLRLLKVVLEELYQGRSDLPLLFGIMQRSTTNQETGKTIFRFCQNVLMENAASISGTRWSAYALDKKLIFVSWEFQEKKVEFSIDSSSESLFLRKLHISTKKFRLGEATL